MAAALATVTRLHAEATAPRVLLACEPTEPWGATPAEPVRLDPLTGEELARIHDGECDADLYERGLAWAARVRSAIDVRLAEGLHLLRKHDRLAELCFRLDDYVREVLDLGEHAGVNLAKLGGELRERPLLKAAMEAGRVRLRAAQTVARVAVGDAEAFWVERRHASRSGGWRSWSAGRVASPRSPTRTGCGSARICHRRSGWWWTPPSSAPAGSSRARAGASSGRRSPRSSSVSSPPTKARAMSVSSGRASGRSGSNRASRTMHCIHAGWLSVTGLAPDELIWRRKGVLFTGSRDASPGWSDASRDD